MEITETRVSPIHSSNSRLRAYVSVTFDNAFVVRDIRIIEGKNGLFVAMPSKKTQKPCSKCGYKNATGSRFCGSCGSSLPTENSQKAPVAERHKDLAHPINSAFREYMQTKIIEAYKKAIEKESQSSPNK
ncbi:MAG: septation protein SpoVG family protein [Candidatus Omnitrophica bacterium]|nr:septation protein SpoVG family protein [Candidatus Omnitrophota bacterium]